MFTRDIKLIGMKRTWQKKIMQEKQWNQILKEKLKVLEAKEEKQEIEEKKAKKLSRNKAAPIVRDTACPQCGKLCAQLRGLASHLGQFHGTKKDKEKKVQNMLIPRVRCTKCFEMFTGKGIKIHRPKCTGGVILKAKVKARSKRVKKIERSACPGCGGKYSFKYYKTHQKTCELFRDSGLQWVFSKEDTKHNDHNMNQKDSSVKDKDKDKVKDKDKDKVQITPRRRSTRIREQRQRGKVFSWKVQTVMCEICMKMCKPRGLLIHQVSCKKKNLFCKICDKRFVSLQEKRIHHCQRKIT